MNRNLLDLLICPDSKSPLELEAFESEGEEVEFGVLRGEAGEYPVVAGIPIFEPNRHDLLRRLRAGRHREAVALATIGPAPTKGLWHFTSALKKTYRLRGFATRVEQARQRPWLRRVEEVMAPADDRLPSVRRLLEFAYRECGLRAAEVFNYNYYRYGMPRHLIALSFIQAIELSGGPVLDLACGAGHITWAIERRVSPKPVVGFDSFFYSLYIARKRIAPNALFACGDVCNLPFRGSTFSTVFCSDAFHNFTSKWASLREMERVLQAAGPLMLTSLTNKLFSHKYPGKPLTPAAYQVLLGHLFHRFYPDRLVLERYLAGRGLPAKGEYGEDDLRHSPTLSVLAGKGRELESSAERFHTWPHAEGELGVNPLYESGEESAVGRTYLCRFPSDFYAEENALIKTYLPEKFSLSREQELSLQGNRRDGLEPLLQRCAVLGFPSHYLDA